MAGSGRRNAAEALAVATGERGTGVEALPKTLPGVVCQQWVRCGRPGCRCARGQLHGPYAYHFARENGRLRKRYVGPADLERGQPLARGLSGAAGLTAEPGRCPAARPFAIFRDTEAMPAGQLPGPPHWGDAPPEAM